MKERKWWIFATLMALLATIAAGCGDDNEEGAAPRGPTATEAPSAAAFEPFDCDGEYPGTAPDDSAFPLE
jgi:hypothetical protein